jgi:hypothetical protein
MFDRHNRLSCRPEQDSLNDKPRHSGAATLPEQSLQTVNDCVRSCSKEATLLPACAHVHYSSCVRVSVTHTFSHSWPSFSVAGRLSCNESSGQRNIPTCRLPSVLFGERGATNMIDEVIIHTHKKLIKLRDGHRDIVSLTTAEAPIGSRIFLEENLSTTELSASVWEMIISSSAVKPLT